MSTEAVSVATDTPTPEPSMEEQLANAGLDPEGNPLNAQNAEQPLLGKFQTVEDLAKAYSELEKKMGSLGGTGDPAKTQDLSINGKTAEGDNEDDATTTEHDVDMDALLAAGTISQEIYDTFVAGQEAAVTTFNNAVYEAAGGADNYNAMIEWAADNLPEAEIDVFNNLLNDGNLSAVGLAISGMQARMSAAGANEPARTVAGGEPASLDAFNSWAEVHEAMADPRYSKDPHFNQQVVEKLGRSKL